MEALGECCIPSFARGLEILVVDHDMMSLMRIAWLLEQFAFKVTTTELGSVALSMIEAKRERSFNLVMVNVDMIDMSVLDFIRIMLEKSIPVILTTTSEHAKMALKGLKQGATFFYEKPVCLDELRNVWQHVYRKKRNLTKLESNSGAAQEKKVKRGRKPTNLKLLEPSGSANKVLKKRGRKKKNKETAQEVVEVLDCGAGDQEVTDDPKGKRKVSEEEVQFMSGNEIQGKRVRAEPFNGSGDLLVLNDPKGKQKLVEAEVTPIEVDDEPKQTQNSGIGTLLKESENKETEYGMDWEQNDSRSESAKEDAEKDMREKIMSIAGDKKSRIVWTKELHYKFTQAVSLLGDDKAVPKMILEMMNAPNLTHRQVASHLQKYKNQVKQIGNAAATSPAGPRSSSLNTSGFKQVPEMTSSHAHENSQGGDITQSLQKPMAPYNSTFLDARFSFNERLKLASSYINAQNQNQLVLPFQGLDSMSANVSSRNHVVPLPMQGLETMSANISTRNQGVPEPMQGLDPMSAGISSRNQVVSLPLQGLDTMSTKISLRNQGLRLPLQGLDTMSANISSGNQAVPLPMPGLDNMSANISTRNQVVPLPMQGLDTMSATTSTRNHGVPLSMQGLDTMSATTSRRNQVVPLSMQGGGTMSANNSRRNQVVSLPMEGLDTMSANISTRNPVAPLPMQGIDTMSANISSRNQGPLPMQGLDVIPGNVTSENQLVMPIRGMHAIPGSVTSGNQLVMPIRGIDAMPGHVPPKEPSIAEKYLINFTEENRDLPATNVPAAPPAGLENQNQHQSIDDYSDILKYLEEERGDMDQYFEWLNSDLL